MKKKTSLTLNVMMLFLIGSNSSCASLGWDLPPALDHRTLRLSKTDPRLEYQFRVCTKKFLGMCTATEMKVEHWDLRDPQVREMLINKGFVMKKREDVSP